MFRDIEKNSIVERVIEELKAEKGNHIRDIIVIDSQESIYRKTKKPLLNFAQRYLHMCAIDTLYLHQAQAIDLIREGKDVIITTGSGSGKSLAFNIPVLECLEAESESTALYIYPLKALANDQLKTLKEIAKNFEHHIGPAIYDGDTPKSTRRIIRSSSRLILTNPYELHLILPYHSLWAKFFKGLRFIVVDEAHIYRGVFGTNVAYLLRRVERIANRYGAYPRYILSSASLGNPEEFGKKLIGRDVSVVCDDGSPKGKRYLLIWNSNVNSAGEGENILAQAEWILWRSIKAGAQALLFVETRSQAERLYSQCKRDGIDGIRVYRAGYMPEKRREIERELRDGIARGVISTSALELGIDIGGLDLVIMLGYPGTISRFWQRAGRAGRKNQDALIVFMATSDALDQYLVAHPEILTNMKFESAILGLDNPYILKGQILCAVSELPIDLEKEKFFVDEISCRLLDELVDEEKIYKTPDGLYCGNLAPHKLVNIGGLGDEQFDVVCDGKTIERIELWRAYKTLFYSAVYLYEGETYVVKDIDPALKIITLERRDVEYYIEPIMESAVKLIGETPLMRVEKNYALYMGSLVIREDLSGFLLKFPDKRIRIMLDDILEKNLGIDVRPFPVKPEDFETKGIWLEIGKNLAYGLGERLPGALHALEHVLIGLAPLILSCDRWDLGGVSSAFGLRVFIYEGVKGGVGLSEKLFERFGDLIEMAKEHIENCSCENGCPSCVLSPKCGNNNEPMDKLGSLLILKALTEK